MSGARESGNFMTFQISQQGKEYLKTAETLLHAARTMIDGAIARQLETLADDYQRRAERHLAPNVSSGQVPIGRSK